MRPLSIFNSRKKMIARCMLILAFAFILFVATFEYVLYTFEETLPYDKIITKQQRTDEFYFPRYSNVRNEFKIKYLLKYPVHTIALGTSRIIQMRQSDFEGGQTFFNAAVDASTGGGLDGMIEILKSLENGNLPKRVIMELDPWVFNPNYPSNRPSKFREINGHFILTRVKGVVRVLKDRYFMYNSLSKEEENIIQFLFSDNPGIGLNTKLLQAGFKKDGSFIYPSNRKEKPVLSFGQWKDSLEKDNFRFSAAQELDQNALKKFQTLLAFCKANDIEVIGIMLPFRTDFYEALLTLDTHSLFLKDFRERLPEIMIQLGFRCLDFSAPELLNLTDGDFNDEMHVKSSVYRKIATYIQNPD